MRTFTDANVLSIGRTFLPFHLYERQMLDPAEHRESRGDHTRSRAGASPDPFGEQTCRNCGALLAATDERCPECGALARPDLDPQAADAPPPAPVGMLDFLALSILVAVAGIGAVTVSALLRARVGEQAAWPARHPLETGALASGAILVCGVVYLLVQWRRNGRR